jgi:hypothetical protein
MLIKMMKKMQISTTNDVGGFCENKLNYHVPIHVISFSYE